MIAWDYLIVTASNVMQAEAYEAQLAMRSQAGLLPQVQEAMVVADPGGRRVGSGGSTLHCLRLVRERESDLSRSRILIVHAGGDSKRLPAYGPCGKIFVPVPGSSGQWAVGGGQKDILPTAHCPLPTLFDRLVPPFMTLPGGQGAGQVVVASGDALLLFDPSVVQFNKGGMTALGCYVSPEEASRHGVFCPGSDGSVRVYLQKPPIRDQTSMGAVSREGRTALDVGVMSFDGPTAEALLETFSGLEQEIMLRELDFYREICCAMGSEATLDHYIESARASGTRWSDAALTRFYPTLKEIPFHLEILPQCEFLHFGATGELAPSGVALIERDSGGRRSSSLLMVNNQLRNDAMVTGVDSWVEGCCIGAPLALQGHNMVVGIDVHSPLTLPPEACLDVLAGRGKWFVRCYGVNDAFKDGRFHGRPLVEWLAIVGAKPEDVWDGPERTLWDARVFPAAEHPGDYRRWLWMFEPETATPGEKRAFLEAERYSAAQTALLADQQAFHTRRSRLRKGEGTC